MITDIKYLCTSFVLNLAQLFLKSDNTLTFSRLGNVLLSHGLSHSTFGNGALNVRVQNGIVCYLSAKAKEKTSKYSNMGHHGTVK